MTSQYASLSEIPILQGSTNYTEWAMEVESTAQLGKFWRAFVTENEPVDDTAAAKEHAANREESALGLIKKTVIKTIQLELRGLSYEHSRTVENTTTTEGRPYTAKMLWEHLATKYSTKEGITSFYEFGAIFRATMVDDGTLEQQINKLSDMRSICAMNEFELKDWQFSILVLHALPPSYRHLPNALLAASSVKQLNFEQIRTKILEQESLRKGDMTASANLLSSGSKPPKKKDKKPASKDGPPPSPCRFCKGNHWNDQCKNKPSSSTQPNATGTSKPDKQKPGPSLHVLDTTSDREIETTVSCYIGLNASTESWLMDSGATDHMTPYGSDFAEYATLSNSNNKVILGDGRTTLEIIGKGTICRWVESSQTPRELRLTNVLHVRGLKRRFLSTSRFTNAGFTVAFTGDTVAITKGNFRVSGSRSGPLFICSLYSSNPNNGSSLNAAVSALPIELWHQRMGHINWEALRRTRLDSSPLSGIKLDSSNPPNHMCEGCVAGKAKRKAFKSSNSTRVYEPLEIIHSDLQGPMSTTSIAGYRYSCVFTCGGTRYVWVYYLKSKDQTLDIFKKFVPWVERLTGWQIRTFRSDRGGEFMSAAFDDFLAEKGISRETSAPHTPQQNGLAERMNQSLLGGAKAMRIHAGLSEGFWADAMMTASHVLNRSPRKGLGWKTPHELMFGRIPDVHYLRVFGCRAWVHIPKDQRTKWKPNSVPMIFVGYEPGSKAYRLWDPSTRSIKISATVRFDETELPLKPKPTPPVQLPPVSRKENTTQVDLDYWNEDPPLPWSGELPDPPPSTSITPPKPDSPRSPEQGPSSTAVQPPSSSPIPMTSESENGGDGDDEETQPSHPLVQPPALKERPKRTKQLPKRYRQGLWNVHREGELKQDAMDRTYQECIELLSANVAPDEPKTYKSAVASKHSEQWTEAIATELKAMEDLGVWITVPRPQNSNVVSCKWVFKIKRDNDGNISRFRARLVARGFSQVYGDDYHDTYAPVTRLETIRLLFALAVEKDWEIRQIDVKTAYLHGNLDEEIFMEPPEGYDVPEGHVLLLKKALYGLKQAGRQWYQRLKAVVSKFKLKPLVNDPHTYVMHRTIKGVKKTLILPVYVDDLIPIGDKELCDEFEAWIQKHFDVTINGDATLFLGIHISRDRTADPPTLCLDQRTFALEIVKRVNDNTQRPRATPLSSNEKLVKTPDNFTQGAEATRSYQSIIGSLMYLMLGSRPDLSYAVGKLARFSHNPSPEHILALIRTVSYVKRYPDFCLQYSRQNNGGAMQPTGFVDSDWAADVSDSRSTAGYVFLLGNAAFSWYSKKQGHVSESTADAEYTALFRGGQQAFWLQQFHQQIGLKLADPVKIYCNSEAAITIAQNQGTHTKSKAIRIETHSVRDRIENREIEVKYIASKNNTADIFTKSLPRELFESHRDCLGLIPISAAEEADISISSNDITLPS